MLSATTSKSAQGLVIALALVRVRIRQLQRIYNTDFHEL